MHIDTPRDVRLGVRKPAVEEGRSVYYSVWGKGTSNTGLIAGERHHLKRAVKVGTKFFETCRELHGSIPRGVAVHRV